MDYTRGNTVLDICLIKRKIASKVVGLNIVHNDNASNNRLSYTEKISSY